MTEMERARQRTRTKYKTVQIGSEKVKVTAGKETVRTGYCWLHDRRSSRFEGPNDNGWVFWCLGPKVHKAEVGEVSFDSAEIGHYFVNEPAQ